MLGYDSPILRTVQIATDVQSRPWEAAPDSSIEQGDLEQNVRVFCSIRIRLRQKHPPAMSLEVLRVLKKHKRPLVGVTRVQIEHFDDIGLSRNPRGCDRIRSEKVPTVGVGEVGQARTEGREKRDSNEIIFGGCHQ